MKPMITALAATIIAVFSTCAFADEAATRSQCLAEAQKLCPGLTFKDGLGKCIKEHKGDFSKACQEQGAKMKQEMIATMKDCKGDAKTLCKDVESGGGRVVKCLVEKAQSLSPACKAHISKIPAGAM